LYARGRRRSDGTLDVSRAWVDIRNFPAEITYAGRSELTTRIPGGDGRALPMRIRVAADTEVDHPGIGHFVRGDVSHLQESDIVQIVGYGDPVAGTFTATRMFVLASARWPSPPPPDPDPEYVLPARGPRLPGPDPVCPYYWYGIASWFCCGGVLACGATCTGSNCGNPCGGTSGLCDSGCPTCRTDYNQMAWPQLECCCECCQCISDCGGNTCSTTCCSGLPLQKCGTSIPIYDACTGGSVTAVITDCGPCVYCRSSYGCQGFTRVKFDLTACAFSAIAPLGYGLTDVQATTYSPC